ncbi:hypothetical protein OVS_00715 [Mycoplasma ovis str. Michigan]|uniref:Uncharacterized protein n=1 Tax=Mycoplasma ovis str. Michigan TaxID=1415773 RepID=A0ABM5P0Z8_9MOLU|nr:hypothetical protein [Mycoplasma ovis]AHC40133.1 hypothetical protein OVS_00715 [Mycoplasma ovis str. Michigan]
MKFENPKVNVNYIFDRRNCGDSVVTDNEGAAWNNLRCLKKEKRIRIQRVPCYVVEEKDLVEKVLETTF